LVSLEEEAGLNMFNYNREIMFFRQLILDAQWKDAEEFLTPLKEHSKFEYNSSIYHIRKQKFLEHVEQEVSKINSNSNYNLTIYLFMYISKNPKAF